MADHGQRPRYGRLGTALAAGQGFEATGGPPAAAAAAGVSDVLGLVSLPPNATSPQAPPLDCPTPHTSTLLCCTDYRCSDQAGPMQQRTGLSTPRQHCTRQPPAHAAVLHSACARIQAWTCSFPCSSAVVKHSFLYHGHPCCRAHCSTARWPLRAAALHVSLFQGQPCWCAHCITARWPPSAAALHV